MGVTIAMKSWIRNAARTAAGFIVGMTGLLVLALTGTGAALAGTGQPSPWQINLQGAASPVMESIHSFHTFLLVIIIGVVLLVLALLILVIVRFNEKSNPVPSRTTHNTLIEVLWTVVPVLILVAIAIPSFRLLFLELDLPKADLTVKVTGHQWYWSYEYPDNGAFSFDSLMVATADLKPDQPRLLTVDNEVVVPVNKIVRIQVTAADVIHSFALPSFGVKIDALPGRLNESWFQATKEGVYYGQCSELCGRDHAFMPIAIRVVSDAEFASWVEKAKQEFASVETPERLAQGDIVPAVAGAAAR
ncbi:cytochrome c oxidase subunit II [Ancylobacter pratisalsi]|uniref:Cytochrome c oxidase subunit 2 n=2 Tax=Ancylobacter pratisalsi TaxID=1745854 RepID=A0A6P1YQP9_9HYPH|nr:cytochrome c oxidase subunit II [Ancylobacter pratisalsi]